MSGWQQCRSLIRTYSIAFFAVLFAVFFVFGQASAQQKDAEQKAQQSQQSQELQKAKQNAQKYSQKLQEIQKAAMENNPDLKKKRDELQKMQQNKMEEMVSDNATRMEKLKARMKLRQDKELQNKRKSLQEDFLEAMKKEDPKTEDYLDKFNQARKKIQQMNQQRQQGQGGMQKQQQQQ